MLCRATIARSDLVFESSPNAAEVIRSVKRERPPANHRPHMLDLLRSGIARTWKRVAKRNGLRALSQRPRRRSSFAARDVPAHSSALRMEIWALSLASPLSPNRRFLQAFGYAVVQAMHDGDRFASSV